MESRRAASRSCGRRVCGTAQGCPREKEGEELLRDDDQVCAADKARIHLAGTRSGQRPAPGRRQGSSLFLFHLVFWGVCVCVCEASSDRVELE